MKVHVSWLVAIADQGVVAHGSATVQINRWTEAELWRVKRELAKGTPGATAANIIILHRIELEE